MNIIKKLWQRHFGARQPQSHANKCKKVGEICCPALDFREFLEFVCIHKCLEQKNCVCVILEKIGYDVHRNFRQRKE